MLRACTLAHGPKWEDCLPYAEFSYNNSFQTSLKMSPFEALYGHKCRTPLNWSQTRDSRIFGTDLMMEAEKQVKEIRDRPQLAKSRQRSYYDAKHRKISFEPREYVYLRVTPMKGVKRFQTQGKLAPKESRDSDPRKTGTQIYWSVPSYDQSWHICLSVGIATRIVRSARCVPCLTAKKVYFATQEKD